MSQEIINVLNYLGEQLGIVIDWSSENVWPQIMDILGRYRLMEIVYSCLWIIIQSAFIVYALVVFVKCFKASNKIRTTKQDNFWWYSGYASNWLSSAGMFLVITAGFFGGASLFTLPIKVGDLLKWLIIPEVKYIEMLKGLMP